MGIRVACLCLCLLVVRPPAAAPQTPADSSVMYARFIDVGQGNATLLEFACGAVLIDAGGENDSTTAALLAYLEAVFRRRQDFNRTLAAIIVTHNHVDHTRALREVMERFEVRNLVENGQRGGSFLGDMDIIWALANRTTGGRNVQVLDIDAADVERNGRRGYSDSLVDPVRCRGVDPVITILAADLAIDPGWDSDVFGNKNNHSVVVRVDFGSASFLFTGDLEEPAIERMVERYVGTPMLDVDVWEVGHHGSANGTTGRLLAAMSPRIAVISVGHWMAGRPWTAWAYGHPRIGVIDLLRNNIPRSRSTPLTAKVAVAIKQARDEVIRQAIYATGWEGTLTVRANSKGEYRVYR
jgi:beta-lactamase superfamily II metal-dependent hydrolase